MRRTCKLETLHFRFLAVIIGVAVLCQWNVFGNAFVAGDIQFIQDNPAIKNSGVLVHAFTRGYWNVGGTTAFGGTYYRPFVVLLDALDYFIWGDRPLGFHLTNTLLHVAVCALVFHLTATFFRSRFTALIAGLLFAAHPLHVHAVAYISARSALLCAGFYTASVWAALRYARGIDAGRAQRKDLGFAFAGYVGGLLSLEATITLPVVLVALFVLTPGAFSKRRQELFGFFGALVAVTVGYFVVRQQALGTFVSIKEALAQALPPIPALLSVAKTYAFYLEKLIVPTDVTYIPAFVPALQASDVGGWVSAFVLIALAAFVFAGPKSLRPERFSIAWILLTLAPVSGLVPLDHFVKGQYAYLPSVGACALFAALGRRAWAHAAKHDAKRALRLALAGLYGVTFFAYTGLTMIENLYWRSSTTLFARVFEFEGEMPDTLLSEHVMKPTVARLAAIHYLYALNLEQQKDCEGALPHYLRSQKLATQKRVRLEAQRGEADCHFKLRQWDDAFAAYNRLVDDDPADKLAPVRASLILLQKGDVQRALPLLATACERGAKEACAERERLVRMTNKP